MTVSRRWRLGALPVGAGEGPMVQQKMHVYMMTNRPHGTLYIGVTGDLVKRVWEHRLHAAPGFTDRYNLERLVWFETHDAAPLAIQREKSLKRWYRRWKIALIEQDNPEWRDLWEELALP